MIQLELFTENDFESLISWIDSEELLITIAGNYFSYPLTATQLQRYITDEKSISFSIIDTGENKIIGHAELINQSNNNFKIDKLIVGDKSMRGKGTGQKVMQQLVDHAFNKLNAASIELNVFDWNKNAIICYEKAGFMINPNKTQSFKVGEKNWVTLNMQIIKKQ